MTEHELIPAPTLAFNLGDDLEHRAALGGGADLHRERLAFVPAPAPAAPAAPAGLPFLDHEPNLLPDAHRVLAPFDLREVEEQVLGAIAALDEPEGSLHDDHDAVFEPVVRAGVTLNSTLLAPPTVAVARVGFGVDRGDGFALLALHRPGAVLRLPRGAHVHRGGLTRPAVVPVAEPNRVADPEVVLAGRPVQVGVVEEEARGSPAAGLVPGLDRLEPRANLTDETVRLRELLDATELATLRVGDGERSGVALLVVLVLLVLCSLGELDAVGPAPAVEPVLDDVEHDGIARLEFGARVVQVRTLELDALLPRRLTRLGIPVFCVGDWRGGCAAERGELVVVDNLRSLRGVIRALRVHERDPPAVRVHLGPAPQTPSHRTHQTRVDNDGSAILLGQPLHVERVGFAVFIPRRRPRDRLAHHELDLVVHAQVVDAVPLHHLGGVEEQIGPVPAEQTDEAERVPDRLDHAKLEAVAGTFVCWGARPGRGSGAGDPGATAHRAAVVVRVVPVVPPPRSAIRLVPPPLLPAAVRAIGRGRATGIVARVTRSGAVSSRVAHGVVD